MTAEAISVIDAIGAGPAHVIGYSAGAVVAVYLALRGPELVRSLVLIGSNIRPARQMQTLDPDAPTTAAMRPSYAALSPDGSAHFDEVVRKTLELQSREPTFSSEELLGIEPPSLIIVADRDSTSMDETVTLFGSLPSSQLAVVPGAGHTVLWEKPDIVVQLIEDFLRSLS